MLLMAERIIENAGVLLSERLCEVLRREKVKRRTRSGPARMPWGFSLSSEVSVGTLRNLFALTSPSSTSCTASLEDETWRRGVGKAVCEGFRLPTATCLTGPGRSLGFKMDSEEPPLFSSWTCSIWTGSSSSFRLTGAMLQAEVQQFDTSSGTREAAIIGLDQGGGGGNRSIMRAPSPESPPIVLYIMGHN